MSHAGPETRYLNRFQKLSPQTGTAIKNYDSAGNLTELIANARASINAQERNTKELFATAQELVAGIDTTQQMFGHTFVKNMPLPTGAIKESPSQQLGYVQLTMRFFQAGIVHFIEQMSDAQDRIEHLETLIGKLSEYDSDINILGEMKSLDLDQLEQSPKSFLTDVTKDPAAHTPPTTPSPPKSPVTHKGLKDEKRKDDMKDQKRKK